MGKNKLTGIISFIALASAAPLLFICSFNHWCMAGHNQHNQLENTLQLLNDIGFVTFLTVSLVVSLINDLDKSRYYMSLLVFVLLYALLNIFALVFAPFILYYHLKYHLGLLGGRKTHDIDIGNPPGPGSPK